ncbi:CLUMA_CG006021, isoform A [Clunio marinus]|uniref:CLUMA_CG006021, isoform A n=1 Tax=Clunio marinus TaxID=568069 RepID=A0A1J1HWU4_9DIPT|nr:CLUMA_CG006021, isoform A [Clunio marinus]
MKYYPTLRCSKNPSDFRVRQVENADETAKGKSYTTRKELKNVNQVECEMINQNLLMKLANDVERDEFERVSKVMKKIC